MQRAFGHRPAVDAREHADWTGPRAPRPPQRQAQALVLATNTMHKLAAQIEACGGLPRLHIADATGAALRAAGVQRAALPGTRFTMEDAAIVIDPLAQRHGLQVRVPGADDRELLHRVIYDELCRGVINDASRAAVVAVVERQRAAGAQAVILGCTELTLLVDQACSPLPVFDTTALHCAAAVHWILANPQQKEPR